ncbi:MAG TPA: sigma-70 family RNA polymerase sigma factor [Byssovorax sp.]|jgi:RNA polymerase sigma-70 factor (ECF subfamily)
MGAASPELSRIEVDGPSSVRVRAPTFEEIYEEHFAFVFRNARRLGVADAHVDDAVQEVFLVLHRRLGEFEGRSSMKTWLFGVLVRVAADQRRLRKRKSPEARGDVIDAAEVADPARGPYEQAARSEAARTLHRLLDELPDERRAVFVLAELEQMSAPEIAEALGQNVNTVYARLRSARQDFEAAVARERARDAWRLQ